MFIWLADWLPACLLMLERATQQQSYSLFCSGVNPVTSNLHKCTLHRTICMPEGGTYLYLNQCWGFSLSQVKVCEAAILEQFVPNKNSIFIGISNRNRKAFHLENMQVSLFPIIIKQFTTGWCCPRHFSPLSSGTRENNVHHFYIEHNL